VRVTEKLIQSLAATNQSSLPPDVFPSLQEDLANVEEIMQTMSYQQVMTMAPSPIRRLYLQYEFETIALQALNKKMETMLENEELLLWKRRQERETWEFEDKIMDEEVKEVQKKPAIAGESMDNVGTNAVGDGIETKSLLIMFLSALSFSFSPSGGPSLDMCRGGLQ